MARNKTIVNVRKTLAEISHIENRRDELIKTLNGRLREFRAAADLSQESAARAVGISLRHWIRCEHGENRLDLVKLEKLLIQLKSRSRSPSL
jgi:DNA-binding XRE family transcriptional regulator